MRRTTELLDGRTVVSGDLGDYAVLDRAEAAALAAGGEALPLKRRRDLEARGLLHDAPATDLEATALRTRKAFLLDGPTLHIFVVTLRCDHSCQYCQVSRAAANAAGFDLSECDAEAALDRVFESPSPALTIEFQGGEPALAFGRVRQVVEGALRRNRLAGRALRFTMTSTLHHLGDAELAFCAEHAIHLSTSIDGPAAVHDAQRPNPTRDAWARTQAGLARARAALGPDGVVALPTVTRRALADPFGLIDHYRDMGFGSIFLRPLSPYGFARKTARSLGYDMADFLAFYDHALDHILALNAEGVAFEETYAAMLLRHIWSPFHSGYMDLRSPAGAGLGVLVYNYDGRVYPSDEARMAAETGDRRFDLGPVSAPLDALLASSAMAWLRTGAVAEELPGCRDCAFVPYCGADPVHHATVRGDPAAVTPESDFCRRHMGMFRLLFRRIADGDPETLRTFTAWAFGRPRAEVAQAGYVGPMSLALHTHAAVTGVSGVEILKVLSPEAAAGSDLSREDVMVLREGPNGRTLERAAGPPIHIGHLRASEVIGCGDVIRLRPGSSQVQVLWRRDAVGNALFATERCNSLCLMCSQPPREVDDAWRVDELLRIIRLIDRDAPHLTITGGEPTLLGEGLARVLQACRDHLPDTAVQVLSNGRTLASRALAERLATIHPSRVTWAVPLYGDVAALHDEVMGSKGAFEETLQGLFELGRLGAQVEVRVVLHRLTVPRLGALAAFVYRRLPFVAHVALMGLEPMGYAKVNREALWIDPADYQPALAEAVFHLANRGVPVSIYNLPLCALDRALWPFARQSISGWKNEFLPGCSACALRPHCGGFFASAGPAWRSRAVKPFPSEEFAA